MAAIRRKDVSSGGERHGRVDDALSTTVVYVLPRGFSGTEFMIRTDLDKPFRTVPLNDLFGIAGAFAISSFPDVRVRVEVDDRPGRR